MSGVMDLLRAVLADASPPGDRPQYVIHARPPLSNRFASYFTTAAFI
jgi:hypothetical protein